jgi:hypothetical protein
LAIIVGVALYAKTKDYNWALIGSWRTAIGSMGILGVLLASTDEKDFTHANTWGVVEWTLAAAGVCLVVAGLIVGNQPLFVVLAVDILVLWLTGLARHIFSDEQILHPGT